MVSKDEQENDNGIDNTKVHLSEVEVSAHVARDTASKKEEGPTVRRLITIYT